MTMTLTSPTPDLSLTDRLSLGILTTPQALKTRFDAAVVRYDGWFLVLLAVLMVLAFALLAAMAIWCMSQGKGRFTGNWRWSTRGVSVLVECR